MTTPSSPDESAQKEVALASLEELNPHTLSRTNSLVTDTSESKKPRTVFYLAYGSNLAYSTFQGKRQCRPLSAVNVLVPSLNLTFDLPGLPYKEPCFANSGRRDPHDPPPAPDDYHKDRWHKGLVGVVYELTPEDYAHVLATEGGGASYEDILVECFIIPPGTKQIGDTPTGERLLAHTLFAPVGHPDALHRPDPSYAQPSQRYLDLITTGAHEHGLPDDYIAYLEDIRAFSLTSLRQKLGSVLFLSMWTPPLVIAFMLGPRLAGPDGRFPAWYARFTRFLFVSVWASYDWFFLRVFGEGERTVGSRDGYRIVPQQTSSVSEAAMV